MLIAAKSFTLYIVTKQTKQILYVVFSQKIGVTGMSETQNEIQIQIIENLIITIIETPIISIEIMNKNVLETIMGITLASTNEDKLNNVQTLLADLIEIGITSGIITTIEMARLKRNLEQIILFRQKQIISVLLPLRIFLK